MIAIKKLKHSLLYIILVCFTMDIIAYPFLSDIISIHFSGLGVADGYAHKLQYF